MAIHKLNDLKIKAKIREIEALSYSASAKNAMLGDGQGLYLSIAKNGTASWLFRYMTNGKAKTIGLGQYPGASLQKAREKAQSYRDSRTVGVDPAHAKREEIKAQKLKESKERTFEACATDFIAFKRPSWKNVKHAQQWTNTLTQYAYPVIGGNPINAIDTDEIVKIIRPIWIEKHETATRLLDRIQGVLDYAKVQGWRDGDNPARRKGHLEYLLPKYKAGEKRHHASLPYQELPAFIESLQSQGGMTRYALEFCILCASRTSEVTDATWNEFDLAKKIWTIPGSRMKAGITHRVPLTARALRILQVIKPISGEKYVFITGKKDKPMSEAGMSSVLRRMEVTDATVHGMRSTFRNWAAERTKYPFEVCEHALAHSLENDVAAAYLRTDFFEKRIKLMKEWEKFVLSGCKLPT
jgi:integrase